MDMGTDKGRRSCLTKDRISELPDHILIRILSPFSIREAARTGVLSKRWRYLWTHVTCLNFDGLDAVFERAEISSRYNWVNQVLQLHQGSTLEEFRIRSLPNWTRYSSQIDNWVEFAIGKRVKRLEIELKERHSDYMFPVKPFKSTFGVVCIKSLTHLSLSNVKISDETLQHFLSHCELLEHLSICSSEDLYAVKAEGPSLRLKFLNISDCRRLVRVDIFAPNLVSFIYGGKGVYRRGIVLKHAPLLANVLLAEDFECITKPFLSISSCFSHLRSLSLCMRPNPMYAIMLPEFPELASLKDLSLTVRVSNQQQSLLNLASLIERSPFLHRLTLQLKWGGLRDPSSTGTVQKINKCPHQCLKVVKISGFVGFGSVLDTDFSMYLIENAVMLEKLIIDLEKVAIHRSTALSKFETTEKKLEATRKHALMLGTQLPPGAELIIT